MRTCTVPCAVTGCREWTVREVRSARDRRRFGPDRPWKCTKHSAGEQWMTPTNLTRVTRLVARTLPSGYGPGLIERDGRPCLFWVPEGEGEASGSGYTYGPGFSASTDEFPEGTILEVTVRAILPGSS